MQIIISFSLQVDDSNLHEFLDNHEREFIFGHNPESEWLPPLATSRLKVSPHHLLLLRISRLLLQTTQCDQTDEESAFVTGPARR